MACVDQDLLWDRLLWSANDVGKPPVTADKGENRDVVLLNQLSELRAPQPNLCC